MKTILADLMSKSIDSIPFMCLGTAGTPKINASKIFEALITAGVTGGILLYGYTQTVKVELVNIKDDVREIKTDVRQIQRDIYVYMPKRR